MFFMSISRKTIRIMEVTDEKNQSCFGCLHAENEFSVQRFTIKCEPLKAIIQLDTLFLCYLCKRIAQYTERFIQNVQSNLLLLENSHSESSSLQSVRNQVQPSITLAQTRLATLHLAGTGDEELCCIINSDNLLKTELKEERLDYLEKFDDDCDDCQNSLVQEEDDRPKNNSLKVELQFETGSKSTHKTVKRKKDKRKAGRSERKFIKLNKHSDNHRDIILIKKTVSLGTESPKDNYILMRITEKQCEEERELLAQDETYLASVYKCEDCIKGFMLRNSYIRHMKNHSLSKGVFLCKICKQRFESTQKLRGHKRCHTIRYKCPECDLTRLSHNAIKEHYSNKHCAIGYTKYNCPQCPKGFKYKVSLRKHEISSHNIVADRMTCLQCEQTFATKETLLRHELRKHPTEGASEVYRKRHICPECGAAFKAPSELMKHAPVHSDVKAFYCVECDRSFKTRTNLKRHLRTAPSHTNVSELILPCHHCDRRFAIKRDLQRHINRVHLNIKPYACDKCDRAYINSWSLREHKRYSHDGAKRPLRYPCSMCDKVFDRNSVLKSHMRTHTGERPFQCRRCPAKFTQSSGLSTHVKLVHLKLTKDGRDKSTLVP